MKLMKPDEAWESAGNLIKKYFEEENPKGYGVLMKIHNENKEAMMEFPAAVKHHHSYQGGYIVHVNEVMMAVDALIEGGFDMGMVQPGKAILAAYVHDFDKLERYERLPHEDPSEKQIEAAKKNGIAIEENESKRSLSIKLGNKFDGTNNPIEHFRYRQNNGYGFDETAKVQQMLVKYGLALPDDVLHAVTMHHGGYAIHADEFHMNMSPMATILNMADMVSSKLWSERAKVKSGE
jgi:hypothetical protein